MSHDSTRKSFLAKVLGLAAAGAMAPQVVAASLAPAVTNKATGSSGAFSLRPDSRAVARREGTA